MRRPFRGRRQTLQLKTLTRPVSASFTEQVSSRQRLLATALHLAPCHIFEATHDEIRRLCVKARNPNRNPCRVSRVAVTHRVLILHIYFQTSGALILRPLIVPIERLSLQNCSSHPGQGKSRPYANPKCLSTLCFRVTLTQLRKLSAPSAASNSLIFCN